MRHLASLLLLLMCAALCLPADLKLPDKVTGDPGTFIKIPATTNGSVVKWVSLDPGLAMFPVELLKDTKTAVVTGPAGSYRVLAYTSDATGPSDPAFCTVVVGTPPTPPTPPPDAFTQAVQAAYAQETDPNKAQYVAWVASTYRNAGSLLTQGVTVGDLYASLHNAIHSGYTAESKAAMKAKLGFVTALGIPIGAIPLVMKVIGNDLDTVNGGKPGPMPVTTPVLIDQTRAAFAKYAAALGTLK